MWTLTPSLSLLQPARTSRFACTRLSGTSVCCWRADCADRRDCRAADFVVAEFFRFRLTWPRATIFARPFTPDWDRPLRPDRRGRLCELTPLPGRQSRCPLSGYRPCSNDPAPRRRPRAMGPNSDFRSVLAHRSGDPGYRSMTAATQPQQTGSLVTCVRPGRSRTENCPLTVWRWSALAAASRLVVGHTLRVYAERRCAEYPAAKADDPLRNEHDHFLAYIRDQSRAPALDLPQALAGLKLADAAMESLRLNRELFLSA